MKVEKTLLMNLKWGIAARDEQAIRKYLVDLKVSY